VIPKDHFLASVSPKHSPLDIINPNRKMPISSEARKAPFKVIIVGAGLGGLAAAVALRRKGHAVHVLEGASELKEIGAGIQIPPNSTRLLERWGLKEALQEKVVWPKAIHMRRYKTGEVIGVTPLDPAMSMSYGYP
jgi:salicylate hydroxylase